MSPHQKVTFPRPVLSNVAVPPGATITVGSTQYQVVVEWNAIGWVDLALYPERWSSTGDAVRVALSPQDLKRLTKTLKRAYRQAYGDGQRHEGYEDTPDRENEDLWDRSGAPSVSEEVDYTIADGDNGRDLWEHDADGALRNFLFETFGIETDGHDVSPADVLLRLTGAHGVSDKAAIRLVWGAEWGPNVAPVLMLPGERSTTA